MSLDVHLQIRDVTAHVRGTDPDRPVQVGYDGTRVVVILDADHAETLAQVLARYENLARQADQDLAQHIAIDADTWLHVMVDLLAAKSFTAGLPVPVTVSTVEVLG